jgi:hypothetical protein
MRPGFALLGFAPVLLTACGGTAPRASYVVTGRRVPAGFLRRALLKTASIPSEHVTIAQSITFSAPLPLVTSSCTATSHTIGDVDNVHHVARFVGPTQSTVLRGTTEYEKNAKQQWVEAPTAAKFGQVFPLSSAGFGMFEPTYLKLLRPHRVSDLGGARVDGVPATHYRVWVGGDTDLRQPVEMWTDHSGRIRQARFSQGGQWTVTVDLSHFGEHVHIVPPKTAVPETGKTAFSIEGLGKGKSCK